MTIYEPKKEFAGARVVDWEPGKKLKQPKRTNYRIKSGYDDEIEWTDKFAQFLADPASRETGGLIVGTWAETLDDKKDTTRIVKAIVAAADRLPALTRIFFGDITMEESEISWITQTEVGKLLMAYPQLEHFGVRGGTSLSFKRLERHAALTTLIVETGGLPRKPVQQILAADLPALEHLELWLGTEEYGADVTVADLQPLLIGDRFPNLRYLGLRDSQIADEIAVALASSRVLERIKILDLSLGTLGDVGAEALLNSPALAHLEKLNLHHHYCSKKVIKRLKALPIEVDVSDRQEEEAWGEGEMHRYVAVSE